MPNPLKKFFKKLSGSSSKPASAQDSSAKAPAAAANNSASSSTQKPQQQQQAPAAGQAAESKQTETSDKTQAQKSTAVASSGSKKGPKIAIIYYSMYGHIRTLALDIKKGIEGAGGQVDLYQVDETLGDDVLEKMHAGPKSDDPIVTPDDLAKYDAFLFGIPTRFGNFPTQWKAFWDQTGALWASGALYGKYVSVFVSTGTGGGRESTVMDALSTFVHHGMIFIPLPYAVAFNQLSNVTEVHGASPWGAGTIAGADGSRQPSDMEHEIAEIQGKHFYTMVNRVQS
uniref:ARAD1A01144p n=1 Tax=Blastobotrys adeninivorans TaxID=409370 RepID=A0A060SWE4_BLAAD